jgi:hypothetical protein
MPRNLYRGSSPTVREGSEQPPQLRRNLKKIVVAQGLPSGHSA